MNRSVTHLDRLNMSVQLTPDGVVLYSGLVPGFVTPPTPSVHTTLMQFLPWDEVVALRDALNQALAAGPLAKDANNPW